MDPTSKVIMLKLMQLCLFLPLVTALSIVAASNRLAEAQTKAAPKAPVVPDQLDAGIQTHQAGVRMTLVAEHPSLMTRLVSMSIAKATSG